MTIFGDRVDLFEGPAALAFCEALRNCTSLKTLTLTRANLWEDNTVATQLFAAVEGLPFLQMLNLHENEVHIHPSLMLQAGECLARLIARSTSLQELDYTNNFVGLEGQARIFEALRFSHTLTALMVAEELTLEFIRDVVRPALCANTSLRILEVWNPRDQTPRSDEHLRPALEDLEEILTARRLADDTDDLTG